MSRQQARYYLLAEPGHPRLRAALGALFWVLLVAFCVLAGGLK